MCLLRLPSIPARITDTFEGGGFIELSLQYITQIEAVTNEDKHTY